MPLRFQYSGRDNPPVVVPVVLEKPCLHWPADPQHAARPGRPHAVTIGGRDRDRQRLRGHPARSLQQWKAEIQRTVPCGHVTGNGNSAREPPHPVLVHGASARGGSVLFACRHPCHRRSLWPTSHGRRSGWSTSHGRWSGWTTGDECCTWAGMTALRRCSMKPW